jgi:hypothetical protein
MGFSGPYFPKYNGMKCLYLINIDEIQNRGWPKISLHFRFISLPCCNNLEIEKVIAKIDTIAPNKYPRLHKFQISRMRHPNARPIIPPSISRLAAKTGKINRNKNACII